MLAVLVATWSVLIEQALSTPTLLSSATPIYVPGTDRDVGREGVELRRGEGVGRVGADDDVLGFGLDVVDAELPDLPIAGAGVGAPGGDLRVARGHDVPESESTEELEQVGRVLPPMQITGGVEVGIWPIVTGAEKAVAGTVARTAAAASTGPIARLTHI